MAEAGKYLTGQLLLDKGQLHGSFFHRSVILVCQHDDEGAFGLVINRASENKIGDALVANIPDQLKQQKLFLGGPVQPQALSYLHADSFLPEAKVMTNLDVGHSLDLLVEIAESFSPTQRLKVFAGYSGWSPGQLEDEMKRDTWLVHPATLDLVFHAQPSDLWPLILRGKGWKYKLLSDSPEDLSWN